MRPKRNGARDPGVRFEYPLEEAEKRNLEILRDRLEAKEKPPTVGRLTSNCGQSYNRCGRFCSFPGFGTALDGAAGWLPRPLPSASR